MGTRGAEIAECVRDINFRKHLKKLSEERDKENEFRKRRKRKEACTAATGQASSIKNMQFRMYNNDNMEYKKSQGGRRNE